MRKTRKNIRKYLELFPLYSLWDLEKVRALPPTCIGFGTSKKSELFHLYNYGRFTLKKPKISKAEQGMEHVSYCRVCDGNYKISKKIVCCFGLSHRSIHLIYENRCVFPCKNVHIYMPSSKRDLLDQSSQHEFLVVSYRHRLVYEYVHFLSIMFQIKKRSVPFVWKDLSQKR